MGDLLQNKIITTHQGVKDRKDNTETDLTQIQIGTINPEDRGANLNLEEPETKDPTETELKTKDSCCNILQI